MGDQELGSDGEDVLYLSGASSVEEEPDQLEFDMWEGQFSLASALPASRPVPWFSTSDLDARQPSFDTYLAGHIKNGTLLVSPGTNGGEMTIPPPRMTRSLQHMPSYMTDTLEERIAAEVESILDDMDESFDEDTMDILTRNRIQSFSSNSSNWPVRTPPSRKRLQRRPSDFNQLCFNGIDGPPGAMHLSDNEEETIAEKVSLG